MNLAEAYHTLEIPPYISESIVKEQYRWLIKFYHPDNSRTGCPTEFIKIITAYNIIQAYR
jgi:DnaJ-class molecular chaperone